MGSKGRGLPHRLLLEWSCLVSVDLEACSQGRWNCVNNQGRIRPMVGVHDRWLVLVVTEYGVHR